MSPEAHQTPQLTIVRSTHTSLQLNLFREDLSTTRIPVSSHRQTQQPLQDTVSTTNPTTILRATTKTTREPEATTIITKEAINRATAKTRATEVAASVGKTSPSSHPLPHSTTTKEIPPITVGTTRSSSHSHSSQSSRATTTSTRALEGTMLGLRATSHLDLGTMGHNRLISQRPITILEDITKVAHRAPEDTPTGRIQASNQI